MTKRAHTLDPTVSNKRPNRVIFFDTETRQDPPVNHVVHHHLKVGVAKYCVRNDDGYLVVKREIEFYTAADFWHWVDRRCKKKSTTYLVAHNMTFDLAVVNAFSEFPRHGWDLGSFYSKGMVSIFRWKKDDARLVGLDNGNFFAGKLETWGERLNYPKLDIDFDTCTDEELLTYCHRDVDIMVELWRMWIDFLDSNRCGSFKPTVSSTAFNTWRHRFMPDRVHIHTDDLATHLERSAYKGGRTECLWVGRRDDGPFYYMDVNNMYGYVLANCEFPSGLWNSIPKADPYQLAYKLRRHSVIAEVLVDVTEPWFPYRLGVHTCYPVGEFWTTLTTSELKLVIDNGWLRDVRAMAWYRSAPLFADYVNEFTDLRHHYDRNDNKGFSKICKLLVNGLYGKFGQRGMKQEIIGQCDPDKMGRETVYDEEHNILFDQVYLAGQIFKESKSGEAFHSFPAIAAHVTAEARLYLFQLAKKVPENSLFYMDTDSLLVDHKGYEALSAYLESETMGMLKVETTSPWLEINAPKDYKLEGRSKTKGVKLNAEMLADGSFRQTHWTKLNGLIRAGMTEGYMTREVVKTQRRIIHSGQVGHFGWIAPLRLQLSHEPADVLPDLQFPALQQSVSVRRY
jgi:hypothetical protein